MANIKRLPVIELFGPTIQGEGAMAGQRSHFVRLGGCTYRCSWCDSMHAVDPEKIKANRTMMSAFQIKQALIKLPHSNWVTFSGGDPLMHDLESLACYLREEGFKIAVETQGALWKPWLKWCHHITVSPKPPSSGMVNKTDYDVLDKYNMYRSYQHQDHCFKVVVFNTDDLIWARKLHKRYPDVPFYLSVCTEIHHKKANDPRWVKDQICDSMTSLYNDSLRYKDLADVTILPQLHVLAWGTQLGK